MTDIFLYAGEAVPSDILLSDPAVLRSGAGNPTIAGTLSVVDQSDGFSAQGLETFSATKSGALSSCVTAASGSEKIPGTSSQAGQSVVMAASGKDILSGSASMITQAATGVDVGVERESGILGAVLASVSFSGSGNERLQGSIAKATGGVSSGVSGSQAYIAALQSSGCLDGMVSIGYLRKRIWGFMESRLYDLYCEADGDHEIAAIETSHDFKFQEYMVRDTFNPGPKRRAARRTKKVK